VQARAGSSFCCAVDALIWLRSMHDIAFAPLAILLYGSGLLVWPVCALLWRKKRRTRALRWVFLSELLCLLVLFGFAAFSRGILEHGYSWLILMIVANIAFTPLAMGGACYDYFRARKHGA
jgi:hypothetical protein